MSDEDTPFQGIFAETKSADIVLKVLLNIFIFLFIIVFIAWLISRRRGLVIRNNSNKIAIAASYRDLFLTNSLFKCANFTSDSCVSIEKFQLCDKPFISINRWIAIENAKKCLHFQNHYSKLDDNFKQQWNGLILCSPFANWKDELNLLLDCTFHNFPLHIQSTATRNGLKIVQAGQNNTSDNYNQLALFILLETLFSDSEESETTDSGAKMNYFQTIASFLDAILISHMDGKLPKQGSKLPFCNVSDVIYSSESLLDPIIFHEMETFFKKSNDAKNQVIPQTLIQHLLLTKLFIHENKGKSFSFLTNLHIAHTLIEFLLIGRHALALCFRTLVTVIKQRPDWQTKLNAELVLHQKSCTLNYNFSKICNSGLYISEKCLNLNTDCLVWLKAICLETIRFSVAGWPFGSVRKVLQDCELDGYEYNQDELVLLNEPVVFHDPKIWISIKNQEVLKTLDINQYNKKPFIPSNFTHLEDETLAMLTSMMINSSAGFIPREFFLRMLMCFSIEMFGSCSAVNSELIDSLTSVLPYCFLSFENIIPSI